MCYSRVVPQRQDRRYVQKYHIVTADAMSNLDESIGKILLELQRDDPDTFKKLMRKAQEEHPELFEDGIDAENKEIDEYNLKIDEYNKKVDEG